MIIFSFFFGTNVNERTRVTTVMSLNGNFVLPVGPAKRKRLILLPISIAEAGPVVGNNRCVFWGFPRGI